MQIIVAQTGIAVVISQPTICHKSPCQDCQKLDSTVGDAPSQALGYERSHHYLFRLQCLNRQWYEKKLMSNSWDTAASILSQPWIIRLHIL